MFECLAVAACSNTSFLVFQFDVVVVVVAAHECIFCWTPLHFADITEHLGVEPLVDFREGVVGKTGRFVDGDYAFLSG